MSNYHGSKAPNFAQHLAVSRPLMPKKHPITNDYTISSRSLGVGVNGKVLECVNKRTGEKRALKVRLHSAAFRLGVDMGSARYLERPNHDKRPVCKACSFD